MPVNNHKTDISLIKRYLKGELDAHAMHQLERGMQDDPFLMDAMEGYESAGADQQSKMADLGRSLSKRIAFKEKRLVPWSYIAAAASVIFILGIGGALLYLHQPAERPRIAVNITPPVSVAPPPYQQPVIKSNSITSDAAAAPAAKQKTVPQPKSAQYVAVTTSKAVNEKALASPPAAQPVQQKADTTPVNEMVVMAVQERKKKDAESIAALPDAKVKKPAPAVLDRPLKSKVEGVSIIDNDNSGADSRSYTASIVQGRVVEESDGQPMPGVSIRIKGTSIGTQTDINGSFKLPAGSKDKTLVLGYIGYQTQEVPAAKLDSSKTLAMVASNSSTLNEVAVTKNTADKVPESRTAAIIAPHPKAGWDSYNKYLKENALSPDKKTGVVKLTFTVSPGGVITNVRVIKSLSADADRKAIELITKGPAWSGVDDTAAKSVNLSVIFN